MKGKLQASAVASLFAILALPCLGQSQTVGLVFPAQTEKNWATRTLVALSRLGGGRQFFTLAPGDARKGLDEVWQLSRTIRRGEGYKSQWGDINNIFLLRYGVRMEDGERFVSSSIVIVRRGRYGQLLPSVAGKGEAFARDRQIILSLPEFEIGKDKAKDDWELLVALADERALTSALEGLAPPTPSLHSALGGQGKGARVEFPNGNNTSATLFAVCSGYNWEQTRGTGHFATVLKVGEVKKGGRPYIIARVVWAMAGSPKPDPKKHFFIAIKGK